LRRADMQQDGETYHLPEQLDTRKNWVTVSGGGMMPV